MDKRTIFSTLALMVVGGIILLLVEYTFFSDSNETIHINSNNTEKNSDFTLSSDIEKIIKETQGTFLNGSNDSVIENDLGGLDTMFHIAKSINVYQRRNIEFARIIKLCLDEKKPKLAFIVAKKINVYQIRNEQYTLIVDHLLSIENLAFAYVVAKSINVYQYRNNEFIKILNKGFEIRKKSSYLTNATGTISQNTTQILKEATSFQPGGKNESSPSPLQVLENHPAP